jgi:hypothetical protein
MGYIDVKFSETVVAQPVTSGLDLFPLDASEARLPFPREFNLLKEHRVRPNPESRCVGQRAIHDERLQRFAVARYAENLVFPAFVVTVRPGGRVR